MNIKYVTCSGVNETTEIAVLAELLAKYSCAEIGVQVSEKKCFARSQRMEWIRNLMFFLREKHQKINAALHINQSWVEDFGQGIVAPELHELLIIRNIKGSPFFGRIQLNFKIGRERTPDEYKLLELMQLYKSRRFILSYNKSNMMFIRRMYRLGLEVGLNFDILFDESYGEGIEPETRQGPVLFNVCHGYAGGIGPDNVAKVLDQIAEMYNVKSAYSDNITIDAEGKLKGKDNHLDIQLCETYLEAVRKWKLEHL